jgi:DNA-binding transcriptional regulator YiaG
VYDKNQHLKKGRTMTGGVLPASRVVRQKQQSKKRSYNLQALFYSLPRLYDKKQQPEKGRTNLSSFLNHLKTIVMHWIQTIRETLALSQEELARYLQLSVHMIQSVEQGRRQLPFESMRAAISIYNAMKDQRVHNVPVDAPLKTDNHIKRLKRLHRDCCNKLDRHMKKHDQMQRSYISACFLLRVYQHLATTLTTATDDDIARLQWTQQQIKETQQHIKDNHPTEQELLAAEISGLRSMMQVVEEARLKL